MYTKPENYMAKSLLICLGKRTLTCSLYKLLPGYYIFMISSFYKLSGNAAVHISNVLQIPAFFFQIRSNKYIQMMTRSIYAEKFKGGQYKTVKYFMDEDFVSFNITWLIHFYSGRYKN